MSDESNNVTKVTKIDPYKDVEFDAFLKIIGNANLPNWSVVAEALGVSRMTIIRWKEHPLAKQALTQAIEENLRKMTEIGSTDWKMYREKLKLLGIKDRQTIEHEAGEGVSDVLDALQTDYSKVAEKAGEVLNNGPKAE